MRKGEFSDIRKVEISVPWKGKISAKRKGEFSVISGNILSFLLYTVAYRHTAYNIK